ncbi:hypothetical protein GCM10020258_36240 [Sphingomonas yabuuchiae]
MAQGPARQTVRTTIERLHRSLFEFIAVPALIVVAFVILAEAIDWLDNHAGPAHSWSPLRRWLAQYVGDTQSAIGVLTAIAGSLFTVTSITFSILILAVQQGATVLNSQIVDHYLRRSSNRAWFGFFVGISLFALITLVQTTHTRAPIFGVMMSTILGAVALFALILLIYGTIDQMRPATLIEAMVDTAVAARQRQLPCSPSARPPMAKPPAPSFLPRSAATSPASTYPRFRPCLPGIPICVSRSTRQSAISLRSATRWPASLMRTTISCRPLAPPWS